MFFCRYCEIFKNSFFIEDVFITPFRIFLMKIIDVLEFYFATVKLGHLTKRTSR